MPALVTVLLLCAATKYLTRRNLRGKMFILAHGLKEDTIHHGRESMEAGSMKQLFAHI